MKPHPHPYISEEEKQTRFRIRIQHVTKAIGPGKADVLQGIAQTGSIAESGRRLGMSYQRVWSLVDALNHAFTEPLVVKQRGGRTGGGAQLTPMGVQVLQIYRDMECAARLAATPYVTELRALMRDPDATDEPIDQLSAPAPHKT